MDLHTTVDTHLDAYGEPDGQRRAALISQVWTDHGQLVDPPIEGTGHAGISDMAAAVQSQFPGHTFRRTTGIDAHHSFARYGWELVSSDGDVVLAGLDIAEINDNGHLQRIVGFLGDMPAKEGPTG